MKSVYEETWWELHSNQPAHRIGDKLYSSEKSLPFWLLLVDPIKDQMRDELNE